ncbi:hypothetical protein DI272_05575 [Streptomyces sp. Act143]|nr:hypothetical protein DI272_05575 [Streptomyces sp. Act143]
MRGHAVAAVGAVRGHAVAVAVAVVGAVTLVGCGTEGSGGSAPHGSGVTAEASASTPSPAPKPPRSPTSAPAPTPTPVPVTSPGQQLVSLSISGGFAGVSQQVVLRGDGTVHARDNGRTAVHRLSAAEFRELRTLLGDPALDEVPDFTVNTGAADLFQYELRFDDRTVVTDRSAAHPALDRLIDALSEFLPKS